MIDPAREQPSPTNDGRPAAPTDATSIASASQASPAPVARQQRISSLDILRGVAVLGILLMNITSFGLPHWAYEDPSVVGGHTGANLWAWISMSVLFEGSFRALFSMLFGASVILLTSRLEARAAKATGDSTSPSSADIYYRRTIWLIVFGMFNSYVLLWLGDVLYLYGIVGLFLYVLRNLRPRSLILIALGMWMIIAGRTALERHGKLQMIAAANDAYAARDKGFDLSDEQVAAIDAWKHEHEEYKPAADEIQKEIADMQGDYLTVWKLSAPINLWLQTKYLFKHSFLDAACMMLLGMALMKLGVLAARCSTKTYALMLVVGYAIGLAINILEVSMIVRGEFSIESFTHAGLTYDLGRAAMVIGHIGLIILVHRSGILKLLMKCLAACGQMALSNYLMQSVVCGAIFYGFGFGMFGKLERSELYIVVAGVWLVQLIVSPIWLRVFQFGPAEWLWRSLTYWKRQPMLRDAPVPHDPQAPLGNAP